MLSILAWGPKLQHWFYFQISFQRVFLEIGKIRSLHEISTILSNVNRVLLWCIKIIQYEILMKEHDYRIVRGSGEKGLAKSWGPYLAVGRHGLMRYRMKSMCLGFVFLQFVVSVFKKSCVWIFYCNMDLMHPIIRKTLLFQPKPNGTTSHYQWRLAKQGWRG